MQGVLYGELYKTEAPFARETAIFMVFAWL